ncbi:MAG TPA: alpha/beta hydrolase [Chthonomonadaceae bacterium]|nr:alpha/beta hydrolase [Chthonomonadaceae bacterium]
MNTLGIAACIGLAALSMAAPAFAQDAAAPAPRTVRLYSGEVPEAIGAGGADIPSVTIYAPLPERATGAAVVVCPGGGYGGLAPHEGKPIAEWLNTLGVTGIVLKYRLGPRYHHPVMMHDVARAIRLARSNAEAWKLDAKRIGVMGFSAGGHLASTAATHFDDGNAGATDPVDRVSSRPDAAILVYPVITMTDPFTHAGSRRNLLGDRPAADLIDLMSNEKQVNARTPPTFMVHTSDDPVVPMENALLFAMACRKAHVPVELHCFEHGPHGIGLGAGDPALAVWPAMCARWLERRGFLRKGE